MPRQRYVLREAAAGQARFAMQVEGVRSMGRGVLYALAAPELMSLHRELAGKFATYLTPQDKQPLRPHVVVQNKVEPQEARALLAQLQAEFDAAGGGGGGVGVVGVPGRAVAVD